MAYVLALVARVPTELFPWYVLSITVPNMIAIPLVLMEAICRQMESPHFTAAECANAQTMRLFTVTVTYSPIVWIGFYSYAESYAAAPADLLVESAPKIRVEAPELEAGQPQGTALGPMKRCTMWAWARGAGFPNALEFTGGSALML